MAKDVKKDRFVARLERAINASEKMSLGTQSDVFSAVFDHGI
jgi:hypothetical protein